MLEKTVTEIYDFKRDRHCQSIYSAGKSKIS